MCSDTDGNLLSIHGTYSNRINQLETWRHLGVAFIYTIVLLLLGSALKEKGGSIECKMKALFSIAFVFHGLFLLTMLATLFSTWSQRQVLALARSLHRIEKELHLPDDIAYYHNYPLRPILYIFLTNFSLFLQIILFVIIMCFFPDLKGLGVKYFIFEGLLIFFLLIGPTVKVYK